MLSGRRDFTLDSLLTAAAFDSYLPWFARTVPELLRAYDALPAQDPHRSKLAGPIAVLRAWDFRWSASSVGNDAGRLPGASALAGPMFLPRTMKTRVWEDAVARHASPASLLDALEQTVTTLRSTFGKWQMPWGEVNRFQRVNDNIVASFDDAAPSIAVPFTSSAWGSLACVPGAQLSEHEEALRHQRQQLRCGGRIRSASACAVQ